LADGAVGGRGVGAGAHGEDANAPTSPRDR
jgi:hypothetical protein